MTSPTLPPALRRYLLGSGTQDIPLTLSAGVINDAVDSTNLLHVQGGSWVGPAVTNLLANPNAATNTTGLTDHSSTTTRVTTGVTAFAGTAFEVVSGNAAANEGPSQAITGGASATAYTVSVWAWLISGAATVRSVLSDSVAGKQGSAGAVLTATPQKITVSATTGAAAATFAAYVETTAQQAGTWRFGGWQVETGSVANPVALSGSRGAGRGQVPVAQIGMNATQGWAALYWRPGFASGDTTGGNSGFFSISLDANNYLFAYRQDGTANHHMARDGASTFAQATKSVAIVNGTPELFVGAWNATTLYSTVGAAVFATAAQAVIPATTSALDIGRDSVAAQSWLKGDVYWFACGTSILPSNAPAFLNSFGSTKPTVRQLKQAFGGKVGVWDGRTGTMQVSVAA